MYSSSSAVGAAASRRPKRSTRQIIRLVCYRLRRLAKPIGLAMCLFLLSFVTWFGIPSPFAAAFLLMFASRPSPVLLTGLGASLLLRLICGLELDVWQYVGCAGLWLLLQKCHPRAGVETAALGGLAMMPRIVAALAADMPLDILLSCAALPLCMLFSLLLRHGMDAAALGGGALRAGERACLLLLGLLVISGLHIAADSSSVLDIPSCHDGRTEQCAASINGFTSAWNPWKRIYPCSSSCFTCSS